MSTNVARALKGLKNRPGASLSEAFISGIPHSQKREQHHAACLDGDGDLDLFVSNLDHENGPYLLINDGAGEFSVQRSPLADWRSRAGRLVGSRLLWREPGMWGLRVRGVGRCMACAALCAGAG